MTLTINNKETFIKEGTSVAGLLEEMNYHSAVVFVNDRKLNMTELEGWILAESDRVKIIRILGGG